MTEKEKAFLIGLRKLSFETGIVICGCGCCGSPYLEERNDLSLDAGYIVDDGTDFVRWIDKKYDSFHWEKEKNRIIK
ncbi:MAG: hypothetical protein SVO01_00695 [Thermotogota bacterium]|nr:hypothetical protein [Thermotogota bacterium]